MSAIRSLAGLGIFAAVVFAVAGLGALITGPSIQGWYANLKRPRFTPPSWLFGAVWTVLYLTMAVAAWLVWRQGGLAAQRSAMVLFAVQLALNAAWTPVFFGAHKIGAAFAVIVFLWAAILATLVAFWRVTPPAGVLFVPYQLWVTFAGVLNFALWRLNR
jgi:tryptophan-rich sensory protein